jgi:hypothetical protein
MEKATVPWHSATWVRWLDWAALFGHVGGLLFAFGAGVADSFVLSLPAAFAVGLDLRSWWWMAGLPR